MQTDWNSNMSLFDAKTAQPMPETPLPTNVYEKLNFKDNWNQKLGCEYFTTFRLHSPKKYFKGAKKTVYFRDKLYGKNVEIVEMVTITLAQMKPWAMMLDTGYPPEEFDRIVRTMYKYIVKDFKTQLFDFMMLKTIEKR